MAAGTIVEINQRTGMFIVEIGNGSAEYAVFELRGSVDLQIGDQVSGDLDALGGETLKHRRLDCKFDAYGQSGPSSLSACRRQL